MRKKNKAVRLADFVPGQSGTIARLDLPEASLWKLSEMGLGRGRLVKLIRRAPLGDPLEIELLNYRLAIRVNEAAGIWVTP